MADPKIVSAKQGECLCTIAIRDGGFLDCTRLRAEAANAGIIAATLAAGTNVAVPLLEEKDDQGNTEVKHKFTKKNAPVPDLRFVHGSANLPYRDDVTVDVLHVSNYPADKGGHYPTAPAGAVRYATMPAFPTGFGFNQNGHLDDDAFKIEVYDPKAGGNTVTVKLKALKPVTIAGVVINHVDFAAGDPDAALRSVDVPCQRVKAGLQVFRSRYMRLVTHKKDFDALNANTQALYVAPVADGAGGLADAVEVLDQRVRAEYTLVSCPAGAAKCTLVAEAPIGDAARRRRVRAAVHILRSARDGAGVVTEQQARRAVFHFVRQIYAQADLSVKLEDPLVHLIQPPRNLIAIDNGLGRLAEGGKTIAVRVRIDAAIDQTASIVTVAGETTTDTANRLAAEITRLTGAAAPVSTNPPVVGQARGSADILVGDPATQNIRLSVVTAADSRHLVDIGQIVGTGVGDFGANDSHVGTLDERVLIKNNDSGADRIDTFVVGTLSNTGAFGEAFIANAALAANRQPLTSMVHSVVLEGATQQSDTRAHTTIAHEWAHVLMDANHILAPDTELLVNGSPVGNDEQVVNAPRRIGDVRAGNPDVRWDDGTRGNPVDRLHAAPAGLLDAF